MALQRHLYLICYDISEDPKRLARVARYLSKFAAVPGLLKSSI